MKSNRCIRQAVISYETAHKNLFYQLCTLASKKQLKYIAMHLNWLRYSWSFYTFSFGLQNDGDVLKWETKNIICYTCYPRDWAICVNCWAEQHHLENYFLPSTFRLCCLVLESLNKNFQLLYTMWLCIRFQMDFFHKITFTFWNHTLISTLSNSSLCRIIYVEDYVF